MEYDYVTSFEIYFLIFEKGQFQRMPISPMIQSFADEYFINPTSLSEQDIAFLLIADCIFK